MTLELIILSTLLEQKLISNAEYSQILAAIHDEHNTINK